MTFHKVVRMKRSTSGDGMIDPDAVSRYFGKLGQGSAAAVSMMAQEHDLPSDAAAYRLRNEVQAIGDWLDTVPQSGRVLDLGCGAGSWLAIFANRYSAVVGLEQSSMMADAAKERMRGLENVEILEGDVRADLPDGPFDLIFLGGLCMYLNDLDVTALLRSLLLRSPDTGAIILRESTVPTGRSTAQGEYQAVYRSAAAYQTLFCEAGYSASDVRRNYGYNAMVTGEALVDLRRKFLPFLPWQSPILDGLTWWGLRVTAPVSLWLMPRVFSRLGITWPPLQNHFFRLRR